MESMLWQERLCFYLILSFSLPFLIKEKVLFMSAWCGPAVSNLASVFSCIFLVIGYSNNSVPSELSWTSKRLSIICLQYLALPFAHSCRSYQLLCQLNFLYSKWFFFIVNLRKKVFKYMMPCFHGIFRILFKRILARKLEKCSGIIVEE